jgi:hypothetical protein
MLGDQHRATVNEVFARFFESLGYGVTFEGRLNTGERWHEIYDGDGIICQVSFGTPLAEFLADLPYLVEGKSGIGPTDYWSACEDDERLRELLSRVRSVEDRKRRLESRGKLDHDLVGRRVVLAHEIHTAEHAVYMAGTEATVREVHHDLFCLDMMNGGRTRMLNRGMFEVVEP